MMRMLLIGAGGVELWRFCGDEVAAQKPAHPLTFEKPELIQLVLVMVTYILRDLLY